MRIRRRRLIASDTTRAITESSPAARATCRPCSMGAAPSASTILRRAEVSEPAGRWSPIRSIAATSALASTGSSRAGGGKVVGGGAGEVVRVGLGVDLDLARDLVDLGVEDVGAPAEVDDVQDVDVLAQLLIG